MPFVDEPDPRPVAEAVPLEAVTEGAFVVDNLVLSRGGQRILRGVSAEFVAGEVSVIVGGNGSGKSTLLLAMGGRLPFSAGTLRCGGGSIAKGRRSVLRESVGWLGHELGLYADLTVAENLELFAGLAAVATSKWRVDEPDPLGVVPLEQRRVRDLSRGQRQRVALARVLLADPHVLLLDEPTTGLDVRATARLAELLTGIASSGRCVVVVTHDTEFTRALRSGVAPIAVWAMRGGALHRSSSDDKATDGFT